MAAQQLQSMVHKIVGRINGQHGSRAVMSHSLSETHTLSGKGTKMVQPAGQAQLSSCGGCAATAFHGARDRGAHQRPPRQPHFQASHRQTALPKTTLGQAADQSCWPRAQVKLLTHAVAAQQLRSMVHEIVGRINGHYGSLTRVPIHHLDRQLSFHELCALYAITDVALVTSLRDGMNLVSYEFVACQSAKPGVLILSEFAGAAQSLGAGAILVNPWNINDMAAAIKAALTMSEEEKRQRHMQNYMHITIHTSQAWADTFISELMDTHVEMELRTKHIPPQLNEAQAVADYKRAKRRLLVLGYNATLTTAVEAPRQPHHHFDQIQAWTRVNPTVYACVKTLCADPTTTVVIFSGSDKQKLEDIFGELDLWLAAENGMFMRGPPSQDGPAPEWTALVDSPKTEWMESVQLVFDYFCERTPRSFVESRETSVVWNYKYADNEFGRLQARDLLQHLWTGPISNSPVDIVQGSKSVEVRPAGVSKGLAMQRFLHAMAAREPDNKVDFEFVLVAGHFLMRDENLFTFFEGHSLKPPDSHVTHRHMHSTSQASAHAAYMQLHGLNPVPENNTGSEQSSLGRSSPDPSVSMGPVLDPPDQPVSLADVLHSSAGDQGILPDTASVLNANRASLPLPIAGSGLSGVSNPLTRKPGLPSPAPNQLEGFPDRRPGLPSPLSQATLSSSPERHRGYPLQEAVEVTSPFESTSQDPPRSVSFAPCLPMSRSFEGMGSIPPESPLPPRDPSSLSLADVGIPPNLHRNRDASLHTSPASSRRGGPSPEHSRHGPIDAARASSLNEAAQSRLQQSLAEQLAPQASTSSLPSDAEALEAEAASVPQAQRVNSNAYAGTSAAQPSSAARLQDVRDAEDLARLSRSWERGAAPGESLGDRIRSRWGTPRGIGEGALKPLVGGGIFPSRSEGQLWPPMAPTASQQARLDEARQWSATAAGGASASPKGPPGLSRIPSLGSGEPKAQPMKLPPPYLYTCTVGRSKSGARFLLNGSSEVGSLLVKLAEGSGMEPLANPAFA